MSPEAEPVKPVEAVEPVDSVLVALDLGIGGPATGTVWPEPPAATGAFDRTYRVALAMKGGVSLAVWIGGAVAELDILRRIRIVGERPAPQAYYISTDRPSTWVLKRAEVYARLLYSRGYDSIEFDVLAGASAGGLNAILYGVAQRAGASIDDLLEVWIEYGAVEELLRKPGFTAVDSVLRGDEFFWPRVRTAISNFYLRPGPRELQVDRVTVELSATIIDDADRSYQGAREGRGHFRFVGGGVEEKDLFYDPLAAGRGIPKTQNLSHSYRLAYAARTTSSFPGAFEPARIWSRGGDLSPLELAELAGPDDQPQPDVEMTFAFSAHRPKTPVPGAPADLPRPFRVIDGGVTDNIPIDRALRSIRDQPSTSFSNRAILYFEPDPDSESVVIDPSNPIAAPTPPEPPSGRQKDTWLPRIKARGERISRFIPTIKTGISLRGIRESGDDEIAEVEKYRRLLYREQGRSQTFSAVSRDDFDATASLQNYMRYRSTTDFEILHAVFSNPSVWQLGTNLTERNQYSAVREEVLKRLDFALSDAYTPIVGGFDLASLNTSPIASGSQAMLDFCRTALAWMRSTETDYFRAQDDVQRLSLSADERKGIRETIYRLYRTATDRRDETFAYLLQYSADMDEDQLLEAWVAKEAEVATGWENTPGTGWAIATSIVTSIRDMVSRPELALAPGDLRTPFWHSAPMNLTRTPQEIVAFVAGRGIPEALWSIRFDKTTANEHVAENTWFAPLREAQLATVIEDWLQRRDPNDFAAAAVTRNIPDHLDADAKLAGSTLGHFGAFLSQDWRRNDWWWGRMDAAGGMVGFLRGLERVDDIPTPPYSLKAVQTALLNQLNESPDRPFADAVINEANEANKAELITNKLLAGRHTLDDLSPGYVVAAFSRVARVVLRAAQPGLKTWQNLLLTMFFPAAAVFAPLAFARIRLASLGLLLMLAIEVGWDPDRGNTTGALIGFFIAGVAVILPLAFATRAWDRGYRRREKVSGILDEKLVQLALSPPDDRPPSILDEATRQTLAKRMTSAAVKSTFTLFGAYTLGLLAIAFAQCDHAPTTRFWTCVIGSFALSLLTGSFAKTLPGKASRLCPTITWGVVAGALFLAMLAPEPWKGLAAGVAADVFCHLDQSVVALGLIVAAIAAVVTYGWWGGLESPLRILRLVISLVIWLLIGAGTAAAGFAVNLAFEGNAVATQPFVVGFVSWLVGTHLIWWIGNLPVLTDAKTNDSIYGWKLRNREEREKVRARG